MASNRENLFGKIGRLFANYPKDLGLHPGRFFCNQLGHQVQSRGLNSGTIALQLVPDKFYFLLFGAIRAQLLSGLRQRAELVVVMAISGSVGTGWLAGLKRTSAVCWLRSRPWIRGYGSLVSGVAYRCATWRHPISDLVDWARAGRLWSKFQQQGENPSLRINGIEVADLIIDSYLRFKPSPEFIVSDPFVRRLVWQALRDTRQAHTYFGHTKPTLYLTSYTTYLEHGIPARVALLYGTHVWAFGNVHRFGKKLSIGDSYHTQDFSRYRSGFEALDCHEARLQLAREQLEYRLSGGIDKATTYMRKSAYAQADIELPDGLDGAAVIFLHDFYDSPHVYPDLIFNDFWQWVCFTIDAMQRAGAKFFLKPHPNQIALSDLALDRLRHKYPELNWLPVGVSNVQLVKAGIVCGITVYGTVAHELAYLGVPSICCARHPHYTFDFCRTARTRNEYKGLLETYGKKPLSKEEMRRQALAFYYMHNLYGMGDDRELQKSFVAFKRACNMIDSPQSEIAQAYNSLVNQPNFSQHVVAMVDGDNKMEANQ